MERTLLMVPLVLLSCQPEPTPDPTPTPTTTSAATWEGCAEVKGALENAELVFTPPTYDGALETWQASFFGSHFRIPQGEWDPLPAHDEDGSWTVVMVERDTNDAIVWTYGPQPDTSQDQALRKRAGKPATLHELLLTGYRHTAADLTCAAAAEEDEARIAEALIIKDIAAPGETLAVHHNLHGLDDFARFAALKDHGQWQWEVWYPLEDKYVQVTYRLHDEARARALAATKVAAAGRLKDPADALGGPKWLAMLESALHRNDPADWARLRRELENRKAGGKVLGAIDQLAQPVEPQK